MAFTAWMLKHAFIVSLRKRSAADSGTQLLAQWHSEITKRLRSPRGSFQPVIFASERSPPKLIVHGVLLLPTEDLAAFEQLRAASDIMLGIAATSVTVQPFSERLVQRRFPRDLDRSWMWTSFSPFEQEAA